ncbi:hypothetical protein N9H45_02170 [Opitutales bacterium]|nr:hypothetical protein [Opitutales bacterium]
MDKVYQIAVFVSDHGFGHGTRTCSVLKEIVKLVTCELTIFSNLPSWFFDQNLGKATKFKHYQFKVDIGLIQNGPFIHDVKKTIKLLIEFLEFKSCEVENIEEICCKQSHDLIISDISPLGIHLADKLNIPSVLVENFTWEWIYEEYRKEFPDIEFVIMLMKRIYERVNLRIQATPFCNKISSAIPVPPISRKLKEKPYEIKKKLGIPIFSKVFLITTGGIFKKVYSADKMAKHEDCTFICSSEEPEIRHEKNLISLPLKSEIHYPDLVNTSDLVVGKVGYGTLAECWLTDTPLLGCFRENFRESHILQEYANKHLHSHELSVDEFEKMNWIERAIDILEISKREKLLSKVNGAEVAAQSIAKFISKINR